MKSILIIAGLLVLVSGAVMFYVNNGPRLHRNSGLIFVAERADGPRSDIKSCSTMHSPHRRIPGYIRN